MINNKHDYEEIEFNSLLKGESVYTKALNNKESKEYINSITKGFVWIFMLMVSVGGAFLIFKTPYYEYYDVSEPIMLDPKAIQEGRVSDDNLFVFDEEANAIDESQAAIPDDLITQNLTEDPVLEEEPVEIEEPVTQPEPAPLPDPLTSQSFENEDPTAITQILKSQQPVVEETAPETAPAAAPKEPETIDLVEEGGEVVNVDVWLVNLYSSTNKDILPTKINQFEAMDISLDETNSDYYFTPSGSNGSYRLSVAKKGVGNMAYFVSSQSAKEFCDSLKSKGIDCFISSVDINNLEQYKAK